MKEDLIRMGLTEGEARAYLALLKLGQTSIGKIIKESGIANSKIYEVLNRLINKGLVTNIIKEKTKYFQAAPPYRLNDFIEKKHEEIESQKTIFSKILPALERIPETESNIEEAKIFKGFSGIKTAYELLFREKTKKDFLFLYVPKETTVKKQELFYRQIYSLFRKKKIPMRGITTVSYRNSKHFFKPPEQTDLRFVDFPLPGNIDIYSDYILIVSWSEHPTAYLIRSKEIAENYRHYFEEVWGRSEH